MAWIIEGDAAPPPPPQSINPDLISQELRRRGLSDAHAQGIISNIQRESGFNPAAMGDQGTAHGLFQHRLDRADALKKTVPDWQTNWMGQVDFALNEPEGKAYQAQQFANPAAATTWFKDKFERPAGTAAPSQGRWVIEDAPKVTAPKAPQSDYQKRAEILRESYKYKTTPADPAAFLFPPETREPSPLVAQATEFGKQIGPALLQSLAPPKTRETSPLVTDFGKQLGPAAWSGVQTISQAIAPWVTPFPGIVNPALGALDQKIASATGTQPPAPVPAGPKDMSALNPMPEAVTSLFQAGQQIAQKVGLGKEFDALTNMYPVYGPMSAVVPAAQWAKSKMPGAKAPPAPPPRPFGAEPSFVDELPKPKPPAPPPAPEAKPIELREADVVAPSGPMQPEAPKPPIAFKNVPADPLEHYLRTGERPVGLPPEQKARIMASEGLRRQVANGKISVDEAVARSKGIAGDFTEADATAMAQREGDILREQAPPKPPPVAPAVAKVAEVAPQEPPLKPPESPVAASAVEPAQSLAPPPVAQPAAKGARRKRASQAQPEENLSLSQWTKNNGGAPAQELRGEARRLMREKNVPGMWSNDPDYSLNELAEMAHAQGFIDAPETPAYLAALRDDLTGKPVLSAHREGFQSGVEQQTKAEFRKQDIADIYDAVERIERTDQGYKDLLALAESGSPAVKEAARRQLLKLWPDIFEDTPPVFTSPKEPPEVSAEVVRRGEEAKLAEPSDFKPVQADRPMVNRKGEKLVGQRKDQMPAVGPPDDFRLTSEVTAPPPKPGEKQGELAGVASAETGRKVPEGATKGTRQQSAKPTELEKIVADAEEKANQFVLKETNSTLAPEEMDALLKAAKNNPRGGVGVPGEPLFIKGKDLRDLEYDYAKAVTAKLPVDATGGDPIWLTRKKVAFNKGTGVQSLLPNSLVYRGVKAGEKMLEVIDEHPDQVRGIRNYLRETAKDTFEPITNPNVWKLWDMPGARAWAEDHIQFGPNTGGWQRTDVKLKKQIMDLERKGDAASAVEADRLKKDLKTYERRAAFAGKTFESLTPDEQSQYLRGRMWFDRNISEPMGFDPYDSISDYFPHMREFIETGRTIEIKVGDEGRIPKTLADSVSQRVLGWMEKPRTVDAPAEHYDLDAIYGLINGVSRRIGLSGGMDPRFGTPVEGLLKRLNPVLEALSKEEPALIPHAKRMIERVLGHAERPESPMTDLILQTQALRTMGGRLMPVVKNHFQKLNTFVDNGPKAAIQGFRDMYDPKRRAIARAAGADFDEGALLADIDMVKEGDTWVHRRGRDARHINDYAMWGMKWSEGSNQVHAFLSALRKGEELYGRATPEAISYARKSQSRTQFGRPSSMIEMAQTSNPGRIAFQLKRFSLAQIDFMQNQLKDPVKAARLLGGMMALYGADGFHVGWDDDIRKHLWKNWPGGIFGAMGTAISDDVSIFPSDVVRSFGFFMPGPFASMWFDGLSAATGKSMNPFEKGIDVGSPLSPEQRMSKGVRAFPGGGVWLNAARKFHNDMKSINANRGDILEPVDWTEAAGWNAATGPKKAPRSKTELFGSFLGIQSAKRRDEFEQGRELADIRQEEIRVKRDAADLYVSAQIARQRGDQERGNQQTLDARQMIKDFNTRYKGARIKLTQDLIDQARKRRRYTPAERQRQSLPKDIRGIEEARPPPEE
jgi:hypothetical protein